jgi:hypothetical protein
LQKARKKDDPLFPRYDERGLDDLFRSKINILDIISKLELNQSLYEDSTELETITISDDGDPTRSLADPGSSKFPK